jgi:hypothetical protein
MVKPALRDSAGASLRSRRHTRQITRWIGLPFRLGVGLAILIPLLLLSIFVEQISFGKAVTGITYWVWDAGKIR